jgi:hypothetical protein
VNRRRNWYPLADLPLPIRLVAPGLLPVGRQSTRNTNQCSSMSTLACWQKLRRRFPLKLGRFAIRQRSSQLSCQKIAEIVVNPDGTWSWPSAIIADSGMGLATSAQVTAARSQLCCALRTAGGAMRRQHNRSRQQLDLPSRD